MNLEQKDILPRIQNGEFIISVQIDPPTSLDIKPFLEQIDNLQKIGVRVVDINSRGIQSHDSLTVACVLTKLGFKTVPHVTARPSSTVGLLDQIRSAYSFFDIRDYLVISGDRYRHEKDVGVFESDSVGLLERYFNHFKAQEMVEDIRFGASVNQNRKDIWKEQERIIKKEKAGADFFMSQPVFDTNQLNNLTSLFRRYSKKPLLVGVWPLIYPQMIEKIRSGQIDGVVLPDQIYLDSKQQKDKLREWGLNQAGYLIESAKANPDVQGVYIVAPARNTIHLHDLLVGILS